MKNEKNRHGARRLLRLEMISTFMKNKINEWNEIKKYTYTYIKFMSIPPTNYITIHRTNINDHCLRLKGAEKKSVLRNKYFYSLN